MNGDNREACSRRTGRAPRQAIPHRAQQLGERSAVVIGVDEDDEGPEEEAIDAQWLAEVPDRVPVPGIPSF